MKEIFQYPCLQRHTILNSNYRIKKVLANSDHSIIYLAENCLRKQKCVVKEFFPKNLVLRDLDHRNVIVKKPSNQDKLIQARKIFFNEALILNTVKHRNIISYLDHFTVHNTGYIVTAFYKGLTLEQYVKSEKQVSMRNFFAQIFIPIINAVAMLHQHGIIHRDLKPNNIMITNCNVPIIIDFGSAIRFQEPGPKKIFVTPGFSPLEFYAENSRQGRFSDIYSLAATLYYYVCGKAPLEVTQRLFSDNLEDIRKYNEAISPWLASAIMKSLAVESKQRFQSLMLLKLLVYWEMWVYGRFLK
jgi:serine/threonine protein kinase